jgi:hypothetical protein
MKETKMKFVKFLTVSTALLVLSACSTIVSGTQQSLFIDTPHADGAECKLTDSKNGTWYLQQAPGSVTVAKGNGPMNIVCTKAGYELTNISTDEETAGATFGNIILGGGIGILVDAASGAAQKYPDKIVVWMKPKHFETAQAQKSWEGEKAEYDRKVAEAIEAKKKEQQQQGQRSSHG